MNHQQVNQRPVERSLQEYLRGIAGGLLFSLPLLYTMEVWWTGYIAHPLRLLIYVLATYTLLLGYNRYGGLRRSASPLEVAIDSVEAMGLGFVIAASFLWLLGRITAEMSLNEIAGQIIVEAMTVSIGVAVGTSQLGGGEGNQKADSGMKGDAHSSDTPKPFLEEDNDDFGGQLVISLCGAVLFAANVAPTEEIIMLAIEVNPERLVGFAVVSIILGALILFYSDFTGSQRFSQARSIITVGFGAIVTYAIALVAAAAILWFFGRFDNMAPITCLAQTVVLGLAAVLGASAGRLLLQ